MDIFWVVFVLDCVILLGIGCLVMFCDDDFELFFLEYVIDLVLGWFDFFLLFIEIIYLYGRVLDVLNNIWDVNDFIEEKMQKFVQMEIDLSYIYKKQDLWFYFDFVNF